MFGHMICYNLIRLFSDIVSHCLQNPEQRLLVVGRDCPELADDSLFNVAQARPQKSLTCQHINRIDPQGCNTGKISGVGIAGTSLITSLGVAINSPSLGQILLAQIKPNPLFAQALTHRRFIP